MKPYLKALYSQRDAIRKKIKAFQEKCKHVHVEKKYGANTGNYDPSADCYWTEFTCLDCNKWWREDESA